MKDRPIFVLLTSSWISIVGVTLVTPARRKVAEYLSEVEGCRPAWRRVGIFFAEMMAANVVIASQWSYRAVEHMDTASFAASRDILKALELTPIQNY
jgi:hypothetical protein